MYHIHFQWLNKVIRFFNSLDLLVIFKICSPDDVCVTKNRLINTKIEEGNIRGQCLMCSLINTWGWNIFFFLLQLPRGSRLPILDAAYVFVCVWSCGQACVHPVSQAKHLCRVYVWDYGVTAISYVRALQPKALSLISLVVLNEKHRGGTQDWLRWPNSVCVGWVSVQSKLQRPSLSMSWFAFPSRDTVYDSLVLLDYKKDSHEAFFAWVAFDTQLGSGERM